MKVAPIVRLLLPWVAVLGISAAIAHAAGDALERTLGEPPAPVESAIQQPCRHICPHWVDISSIDREGRPVKVRCLVPDERFTADMLQVHFDDLNAVVATLCSELWRQDS